MRDRNPDHRVMDTNPEPTNYFTELFPDCFTYNLVAELKKLVSDNPGRITMRKAQNGEYVAKFSPNDTVDVEIRALEGLYFFGKVTMTEESENAGDIEEFEEYANLQILLEDISTFIYNRDEDEDE